MFLSESNKQKFLKDEPYLEEKDGFVDFCLGKTLQDSVSVFRTYLESKNTESVKESKGKK